MARDRVTRKHMCHVFRCDTPARVISNTLRDICKKIMIERSLAQGAARLSDQGTWPARGRQVVEGLMAVRTRGRCGVEWYWPDWDSGGMVCLLSDVGMSPGSTAPSAMRSAMSCDE